jgi:glycosyltransferase involved in cell wall biosynthesis
MRVRVSAAARVARVQLTLDRLGGARHDRPRIGATACWSFPIYSQTFVYEEIAQLAGNGFDLRFFYGHLARREELGGRFDAIWRRRRRTFLDPETAVEDLSWFRRAVPDRVEKLTSALVEASGLARDALEREPHYLMAFSYARLMRAFRPHYLHSYFFYEGTLFTFVASQLLGIPRGVSCYADHMLNDYSLKVVPLHLRTCAVVVATSQRIRGELEAHRPGEASDNIVVKPNAINALRFPAVARPAASPGDPLRVVCVSRLEPKKGLEYLIESARQWRDRGLPLRVHLIGEADSRSTVSRAYSEGLRVRVAELGLQDTVLFEGRRSQPEVLAFLHRAHVFAAPFVELESGDKDGIPTVLLEAMSTGMPVVTTDSGSMTEVVADGRNGLVVSQRDPAALAGALERLQADAALRLRLGNEAAATIRERYDVAVTERILHRRIRGAIAHPATARV